MSMSETIIKKGWTNHYFSAPDEIYDCHYVSGYARAVYINLCRRADSEGHSYPGYTRIAEDVGFSRRTVIRAVEELVEAGLLIKTTRKIGDEYTSNEYILIHPLDVVPPTQAAPKPIDDPTPPHDTVPDEPPGDCEAPPWCHTDTTLVTDSHHPSDCEAHEGRSFKDNNIRTLRARAQQSTDTPSHRSVRATATRRTAIKAQTHRQPSSAAEQQLAELHEQYRFLYQIPDSEFSSE